MNKLQRVETWLLGVIGGIIVFTACGPAPLDVMFAERDFRLTKLEVALENQTATLQRIEATVNRLAANSDLDAKFTENLAQTLLEVREYARGSACLGAYIVGDAGAFEYFVGRPITDCEAKQQEAQ